MHLSRFLYKLFFLAFCSLSLISCSDDDDTSQIRIANLMSDVDEIDLLDNGDTFFSRVYFTEVTDYNSITSESRELEVTQSNTFTSFGTIRRNLKIGADYTLFVFGDGDNSTLNLILDDNSAPSSGKSKLRFVQAASTENGVDVYITEPNVPIINSTPSFENKRFKNISNYVESEGGNYRIRITKSDSPIVLIDSGIINFADDSIYTVILTDPTSFLGLPNLVIVTDK